MSRASLVPFAVSFVAGIASTRLGWEIAAIVLGAAGALAAQNVPVYARACCLLALTLGSIDAQVFGTPAVPVPDVHVVRFPVDVVAVQYDADARVSTTVRFPDGSLGVASLPEPAQDTGARLVLRGSRVPFDGPRNPGEPSPRELAAERGLTWRVIHARVLAAAAPEPRDPTLWIPRARAWASAQLHERFGEPAATLLAGAMWGERGTLAPDLREEFQETGTVHILVTAGLHLGVVAALALGLFEFLRFGRIGASLGAIAVIWLYAAISGDHLPSVRAATMLSFALVARAAGREAFSWNALALAAIVVAALAPAAVTGVSFALSFSCVAAIFAFAKPVARGFEELGAPHVVSEALGVALATQLGTWPLTASAFLVIAPYAPLANVLVVPVVGVAMIGGFLALALTPLPPLAAIAATIDTSLVDWIVAVVRFVASLPGAHVIATPPPPWTIATYDIALGVGAWWLNGGDASRANAGASLWPNGFASWPNGLASWPNGLASWLNAGVASCLNGRLCAVVIIALASALCLWPPRIVRNDLVVTTIDVGQADAILIQTPRGHAYLVDAGGRLESGASSAEAGGASSAEAIGERIVVPFLIRQGIHHLDAVLLSHPHGDHAGGLAPVLHDLGAEGFADSGQSYPGHAYRDALDVAAERRIPLLEPRGGDVWRTDDGLTFRFYGPTLPYITGSRSDINSNSLVFRLEYGRFRMLFMGDAGFETEQRLLASGFDLGADVLKVGHHGSAYGSSRGFVAAVAPREAVICVGRNNLFGHPADSTLATLRAAGAVVHRTDRDAAITIESDGTRWSTRDFIAR